MSSSYLAAVKLIQFAWLLSLPLQAGSYITVTGVPCAYVLTAAHTNTGTAPAVHRVYEAAVHKLSWLLTYTYFTIIDVRTVTPKATCLDIRSIFFDARIGI